MCDAVPVLRDEGIEISVAREQIEEVLPILPGFPVSVDRGFPDLVSVCRLKGWWRAAERAEGGQGNGESSKNESIKRGAEYWRRAREKRAVFGRKGGG